MTDDKTYLASIKEKGLAETWEDILSNYFPNEYFKPNTLGGLYEMGLAAENKIEKKSMGKYYTPDDVAKIMAQFFIELPGDNICDLCCGTGNLIFAVLNELGEQTAQEKISNGNIYLYDIDPIAIKICVAILKTRYKDIDKIHTVVQDCLEEELVFPKDTKIICNPPYGKNIDLVHSNYICAAATKEMYVAFMEKVLLNKIPAVFITPHSYLGGDSFKELRREMCGGKIFAFDNVPGNIFNGPKFGIFNSNTANSTRAAISILNPKEKEIYVAPFIRYKSEERSKILNKNFLETLLPNSFQTASDKVLYRYAVGTEELIKEWTNSPATLNDLISTTGITKYRIDVPNTCRYYTTASARTLNRSGKITLYLKDENSFYLAYAFINSSLCYYWHRMCNGGITYPITLLKQMPIFGEATKELKDLCNSLIQNEETYISLKRNAGAYQENIKFPMDFRFKLTDLLLKQIGLTINDALKKIHNNSCLTKTIENNEED